MSCGVGGSCCLAMSMQEQGSGRVSGAPRRYTEVILGHGGERGSRAKEGLLEGDRHMEKALDAFCLIQWRLTVTPAVSSQ